jgi:tRNA (mo5U34)-methyltransferase
MQGELEAKLNSVKWYHRFEILPGVWTPGFSTFDPRAVFDLLMTPKSLKGKKCLDIGTWDGPLAFEMEARGGEVYALDVQDPNCTAFNTAREILNSKVVYQQGSVYDIEKYFPGMKFDYITYFGVFYHLKNPIGAFEAISQAMNPNAHLYLEGEILYNYSETLTGATSTLDNKALGESDVPITMCYPGRYKGVSNWFVPNLACLRGWMAAAGLDLVDHHYHVIDDMNPPHQRVIGGAIRASDLAIIGETNIFEEQLEVPKSWFAQFNGIRKRLSWIEPSDKPAPAPRVAPKVEISVPPSLYSRVKRRLKRLVG